MRSTTFVFSILIFLFMAYVGAIPVKPLVVSLKQTNDLKFLIGEDLNFVLRLSNTNTTHAFPHQTILVVRHDYKKPYFSPKVLKLGKNVSPGETIDVSITLNVNELNGGTLENIPEFLTVDFEDSTGLIHRPSQKIELTTTMFTETLVKFKASKVISSSNILVIGEVGSGKSSAVNSWFTALSPNIRMLSVANGGVDHATHSILKYSLTPNFNIVDSVGVTETGDLYEDEEFCDLLFSGAIPVNANLVDAKKSTESWRELKKTARKALESWSPLERAQNEVHSVAFFVTPRNLDNPLMQTNLKHLFGDAMKRGYNPMVLASQTVPSLDDESWRKHFGEQLGVSPARVMLVPTYHETRQKNFAIDHQNLMILSKLYSLVVDFLEHKANNNAEFKSIILGESSKSVGRDSIYYIVEVVLLLLVVGVISLVVYFVVTHLLLSRVAKAAAARKQKIISEARAKIFQDKQEPTLRKRLGSIAADN